MSTVTVADTVPEAPPKPSLFKRGAAHAGRVASNAKASYCKPTEKPLLERLVLEAARQPPSYSLDYNQVDAIKKAYKHSTGCTKEEDALFDKIEARVVTDKTVSMHQLLDHLDGKSVYV
jgi:hypothetical protein